MRQILVPTIVLFATLAGAMGMPRPTRARSTDRQSEFRASLCGTAAGSAGPRVPSRRTRNAAEVRGQAPDAYGWALQLSKDEAATLSWVDDAGQKALRVRVLRGEWIRLMRYYVEVVPGGTYNFGLWVKGSGGSI